MRKQNFTVSGKYGCLTVLNETERRTLPSGQKPRQVLCLCDCGNKTKVLLHHLIRKRIRSCGCKAKVKNGESGTKIYKAWKSMIDRVKPLYFQSHLYYEKGINVCDEWYDFFVFKKWAFNNGYQHDLQLDRIDNSDGYKPSNCRFVKNVINVNNR